MKFCTTCGTAKGDSSPFCNQCGKKVEEVPTLQPENTIRRLQPMKSLSLKMKIALGSLIFVIIAGIGLYKWGESVTNQKNVLASFKEHVEKGEVKELLTMIDSNDPSFPITEKHTKDLLTYLKDNPVEKGNLLDSLKEDASNTGTISATSSSDYPPLLKLEKKGKRFFLFDRYRFVLQSFPLYVTTNFTEDMQLYVDDEKVTVAPMDSGTYELGNRLPGIHKIKAVLKSDFVEIEKELEVSHFSETFSELYLDIDGIQLGSNIENGKVLINGKDSTLMTVAQSYIDVGPVLLDGSMKVQVVKETPFGDVQSESIPIEESMIEANVQLNDEQKLAIQGQLESFLLNYSKALMNRDEEALKGQSGIVSPYTLSKFNDLINEAPVYAGYLKAAAVDSDSYYVEQNEGEWIVYVNVAETWEEDYIYSGDPISLSEEKYTRSYMVKFNEEVNEWVVDYWDSRPGTNDGVKENLNIPTAEQKEQFEASKVVKLNKLEEASANISPFVESYIYAGVSALNERDFSTVSDYILPSSTYAKEISDYIKHIEKKGITENLARVDIVNIEQKSEDTFLVSTFEEYDIYYEDGSSVFKSFDSKYEVKTTKDGLKMSKAIVIKARDN